MTHYPCIRTDCEKPVVEGRRFCARHIHEGDVEASPCEEGDACTWCPHRADYAVGLTDVPVCEDCWQAWQHGRSAGRREERLSADANIGRVLRRVDRLLDVLSALGLRVRVEDDKIPF